MFDTHRSRKYLLEKYGKLHDHSKAGGYINVWKINQNESINRPGNL